MDSGPYRDSAAGYNAKRVGLRGGALMLLAVACAILATREPARADDPKATAAQLSDRAFNLLGSLNRESGGGGANPLLSAMATFAGDAQTLSHAIANGDNAAAKETLGTLQSDRATVDAALALHHGALNAAQWNSLKQQLDQVAREVGSTNTSPTAAPPAADAASVATHDAGPPASPVGTTATANGAPPRVVIESRARQSDAVIRLKGYLEGTALKSGGIYQNGRCLRAFKVNDVAGEQKLLFDIGLANPSPDMVLRVTDVEGRSAEATVIDPISVVGESPVSATGSSGNPTGSSTTDGGVEVYRGSGAGSDKASGGGNTAEIPSHGPLLPSPSKRHTRGGKMGNVQVNVLAMSQVETSPPTYEAIGQIVGSGITRAGIYVNRRLVKTIAIEESAGFTSFDETFPMNGGVATVRAYGVGNQFVEKPLEIANDVTALAPTAPVAPMAPPGLAVQITTVRPITSNLYVVAGVVSGRNIASAGLYQNGALVQNLNLGGGLAGILGAIVPGASRSVNFTAQFNPYAGPASVRAFDTSGGFTEQPVMVAGVNPYGASPYAGTNPYGANPYGGVNPFGAPANPYYGTSPPGSYMPPPPGWLVPRFAAKLIGNA
jgi:hypothetical protein